MRFGRAGASTFVLCSALAAVSGCGASSGRPSQSGAHHDSDALVKPVGTERVGSPIVLGRFGKKTIAYVANTDDATLHTLDIDTRRELATTELRGAPNLLFLTRDGRLFVSYRERSRLGVFEVGEPNEPLELVEEVEVPVEPVGLAALPDESTLLVTSGWGRALSAWDMKDLEPRWKVRLEREPRAVIVTDDAKKAFVSHAVGGRVSVVSLSDPLARAHVIQIDSPPGDERNQPALQTDPKASRPGRSSELCARQERVPGRADLQPGCARGSGRHRSAPERLRRHGFAASREHRGDRCRNRPAAAELRRRGRADHDEPRLGGAGAAVPATARGRGRCADWLAARCLHGARSRSIAFDAGSADPRSAAVSALDGRSRSGGDCTRSGSKEGICLFSGRAHGEHPEPRAARRSGFEHRAHRALAQGASRSRRSRARPRAVPQGERPAHFERRACLCELSSGRSRRRAHLGDPARAAANADTGGSCETNGALRLERRGQRSARALVRSRSGDCGGRA